MNENDITALLLRYSRTDPRDPDKYSLHRLLKATAHLASLPKGVFQAESNELKMRNRQRKA